ncbi:MAG: hypothetical protein LBE76_02700 [Nitrososphaerota archaeon]|jgi:hypothetical protein|nr:hypothetical protein [Nitrososphaerota archaeon]
MVFLDLSLSVLDGLRYMVNSSTDVFCFLGFSLDLRSGELLDVLQQSVSVPKVKDSIMFSQLTELLVKYAFVGRHARVGRLVNFKDFSGGYAYENAFN